jgi:2-haloacid dehalogenase
MSSTNKTVIAFDLYGTLLSTESIAKDLANHFGAEKAATVAALWRRYQLEYTWRMNSMGTFPPTHSTSLFATTIYHIIPQVLTTSKQASTPHSQP